jgi:hypothetical protein
MMAWHRDVPPSMVLASEDVDLSGFCERLRLPLFLAIENGKSAMAANVMEGVLPRDRNQRNFRHSLGGGVRCFPHDP